MIKTSLKILILTTAIFSCNNDEGSLIDVFETLSCGSNPSAEQLTHKNEVREYLLYVPSSYDGSNEVPLFMNFHGFGGNATDYLADADMRDLAESEGFILIYPQGSCDNGATQWNPSLPSATNKSNADDFGFIEMLIEDVSSKYKIDSERIYAAGYSNGAMFAYGLACYRTDLVAAIASVSGTMLDTDCVPTHPMPLINIHGTSDNVLAYEGGAEYNSVETAINFWTEFNNIDSAPTIISEGSVEHYIYAGGDNGSSVEHYKVLGGGHDWPALNYKGEDTSDLIWNFVSKHDLSGRR